MEDCAARLLKGKEIDETICRKIYTDHIVISNATEWAKSIARGVTLPFNTPPSEIRRLNVADVKDPVPATEYYFQQSICWEAAEGVYATITDDSFRPIVHLHDRIWASIFDEFEDPEGLYPKACGGMPTLRDPDSSYPSADVQRLPPASFPDFSNKRAASLIPSVQATTTIADGSSSGILPNRIAITGATQPAYSVPATKKYAATEAHIAA
jgi:hypothetical protein